MSSPGDRGGTRVRLPPRVGTFARAETRPASEPSGAHGADLEAGQMVGEYRVEQKVGEGGMGSVYGAVHPLIGKKAAIKVISPGLCTDAEAVERFVQEARA